MNLPESFRRYGIEVFTKTPEIAHKWSTESGRCELSIPASSPSGFNIHFVVELDTVTLNWGAWHTHIEQEAGIDTFVEGLFALLRDMLSPDMRIRELYTWPFAYRGFLESFDGTQWSTEQVTGMIFWNYFGKRTVRTYSNSMFPGRMSKADQGTAPDQSHGVDDAD